MPMPAKSAMMQLTQKNPNRRTKAELEKRVRNEKKLQMADDQLQPPAWLEPGAKKVFNRVVKVMTPTQILNNADLEMLAVYADTYYDYISYKRKIRKTGLVADNGKPNPFITQKRNAAASLSRLANSLGLTPAARASLAIHMEDEDDDDDF